MWINEYYKLTELSDPSMAYFQNSNCNYNRYLRELDQNKTSRTQQNDKQLSTYIQYKIEKPKNPIILKSIYTEDQSQYYQLAANCDGDEPHDDDIYQFIENSKTLKEKIYEKLEKRKKLRSVNNNRGKITETTFRPNQAPKSQLKQNTIYNKLSNKNPPNKPHQPQPRKNPKNAKKRPITEIDQANALWNEDKDPLTFSKLTFYERQEKTLTNRQQYTKKIKDMQKEKEMEGCTFKPQLTRYRPRRI